MRLVHVDVLTLTEMSALRCLKRKKKFRYLSFNQHAPCQYTLHSRSTRIEYYSLAIRQCSS